MADHVLTTSEVIAIWRRRWIPMVITSILIATLFVVLAFSLPAIYRSTGTVLIERLAIPVSMTGSTVPGFVSERIQAVYQRIITGEVLGNLIEEFGLYQDKGDSLELNAKVDLARSNIALKPITTSVINPRSGKPFGSTIALALSFDDESPERSQKVASYLVDLFLAENQKSRAESAEGTSQFLTDEAERLSENISKLEEQLANFKRDNVDLLPASRSYNQGLVTSTENRIQQTLRTISTLEQQRAQTVTSIAQSGPASQLEILKAQLATARQTYSEIHPDVVRLKRSVQMLESGDSSAVTTVSDPAIDAKVAALRTELVGYDNNLRVEKQNLKDLRDKLAEYNARLAKMPEVEREFLAVSRDYQTNLTKYRDVKDKQMEAKLAEQLEREGKTERFTMIDAPVVPSKPIKPDRIAIVLLGMVLSVAAAVGLAVLLEYLDHTVRGKKSLASVLDAPPIGVIPVIH